MKASIVIPSNSAPRIAKFFEQAGNGFADCQVIVVEDGSTRTFVLPDGVEHYSWAEIDRELGNDAWIVPRQSDCVRSFGFLMAKAEVIITLDDDCLPDKDFVWRHLDALNQPATEQAWTRTVMGPRTRGYPFGRTYRELRCALNHGLWTGIPDLDAVTQIGAPSIPVTPIEQAIPRGTFFPMCGMNIAFHRDLLPAMYFMLMGREYPYDRFGDIWCGLFAKKICDHLGWAVRSGKPTVEHTRASDAWANLLKETPCYKVTESLWRAVDAMCLSGESCAECYRDMAGQLPEGDYWEMLGSAMQLWVNRTES